MGKLLKVNVAKSLPFSKERGINRVGDLIYKLRESGKMEGFLPSPSDRVSSFKIDYEKTQKIDFRKVLMDVLGEKEGFSLPLLSALMSWSKEGETQSALEYQSVLAFPFDQFDGIFATVVEEAARTSLNGRMECDGNMVEIPDSQRYSQHIIVPMLKSLLTNSKIPNSYLARIGHFSSNNFAILPETEINRIKERIPEFPNLKLGEMEGNRNYLVAPLFLEIIGRKIPKALKTEPNFQQQILLTSQNFINLFGIDVDVLSNERTREIFISHGINDGAYAVSPKYLTSDFIEVICEAHRKNITDKSNRRHLDRENDNKFSQAKYEKNLEKMEEAIEKYATWATQRHNSSGFVEIDKATYDADSYEEWLARREAEIEAEESAKKAEAHSHEETEADDEVEDF